MLMWWHNSIDRPFSFCSICLSSRTNDSFRQKRYDTWSLDINCEKQ